MQGHSWTNPDDQGTLWALQSKPDAARALPVPWQVLIWFAEPMETESQDFLFAAVNFSVMLLYNFSFFI